MQVYKIWPCKDREVADASFNVGHASAVGVQCMSSHATVFLFCPAEWVREMYAWDAAIALHRDTIKVRTEHPPNSTTIVQVGVQAFFWRHNSTEMLLSSQQAFSLSHNKMALGVCPKHPVSISSNLLSGIIRVTQPGFYTLRELTSMARLSSGATSLRKSVGLLMVLAWQKVDHTTAITLTQWHCPWVHIGYLLLLDALCVSLSKVMWVVWQAGPTMLLPLMWC